MTNRRSAYILGAVVAMLSLLSPSLAAAKPPAEAKTPNETQTVTGSIQFGVGDFGGPVVTIVGGGGGPDHSNCTTDETNSSAPLNTGVEIRHFSMVAKAGGSCNTEPSFSFFSVTVVGNSTRGMLNSSGRIWLGQDSAGGDFYVKCVGPWVGMECYNDRGPKGLTIQAVVDRGSLEVTKVVDGDPGIVGRGTTFTVAVNCDGPGFDGRSRSVPLAGPRRSVTSRPARSARSPRRPTARPPPPSTTPAGSLPPTVRIPQNAAVRVTVSNIFIPVLGALGPPATPDRRSTAARDCSRPGRRDPTLHRLMSVMRPDDPALGPTRSRSRA